MLNRGIILGWEGSPSRKSRLGRETSLGWEGRLCREGWLGIPYSDRQAPEKFLAALVVLVAAWQSWSHFNPKLTLFWEQQSGSRSQEYA